MKSNLIFYGLLFFSKEDVNPNLRVNNFDKKYKILTNNAYNLASSLNKQKFKFILITNDKKKISKFGKFTFPVKEIKFKKKIKKNIQFYTAHYKIDVFKYFEKQIKGFIGIGSAPEFLERLMWKKFPKKIKSEIKIKGISYIKNGDYEYPITHQLIKDGRKNKVLQKKIKTKINITMFHGQKDEAVPVSFSRKVLKIFINAKKKLVVIKNGDHSLSNKQSIRKILRELDRFRDFSL